MFCGPSKSTMSSTPNRAPRAVDPPHSPGTSGSIALETWRPLHIPVFRALLAASLVSDVGTFMQSVGAAWLMVSISGKPMFVALVQTVSTLPFFLIAIVAGSLGDVVDRRKLILAAELWMFTFSVALALLTIAGLMSPWLLLGFILMVSIGAAFEAPAWQAIFPEMVPKEDLPSAFALNGIEFNLSRAIGPGLAGAVVALAGAGVTFVLNAASFLGVITVILRWKRPVRRRMAPIETMSESIAAGFRYFRYAPILRGVVLRAGVAMFFASSLWALLPILARDLGAGSIGYGILLTCFGAGAIAGALLLPHVRSLTSTEGVLSVGMGVVAFVIGAVGMLPSRPLLYGALLLGGAAWTPFMSVLNTAVQSLAPEWARARVLAFYLLVFEGSIAAGSAVWGAVTDRFGIRTAFLAAGMGLAISILLKILYAMPKDAIDLSVWNHWPLPLSTAGPALDEGPVLVTVEYVVHPEKADEFKKAMHHYQRVRRRDGAVRWALYYDAKDRTRYLETFIVHSWAEHLRQHARFTMEDRKIEEHVHSFVEQPPKVSHFIYAAEHGRRG